MPFVNLLKIANIRTLKALNSQWYKLAFKVVPYVKPYNKTPEGKLMLHDPEDKATTIAIRRGNDVYVGEFMEGEFIHDLLAHSLINAGIMKYSRDGEDGFLLKSGGFVNRREAQYFFNFKTSEEAFGDEQQKEDLHRGTA